MTLRSWGLQGPYSVLRSRLLPRFIHVSPPLFRIAVHHSLFQVLSSARPHSQQEQIAWRGGRTPRNVGAREPDQAWVRVSLLKNKSALLSCQELREAIGISVAAAPSERWREGGSQTQDDGSRALRR